jgi:hypothetical protein
MKQMSQAQNFFMLWNQFSKFQDQQQRIKQNILMRPHKIISLQKDPEAK